MSASQWPPSGHDHEPPAAPIVDSRPPAALPRTPSALNNLTVAITADRKGAELRNSLQRLGARVVWGSTMRAVAPEFDALLIEETDRLLELQPTWFAVSTGTGLRSWIIAAHAAGRGEAVEAMLRRTNCVARGAKSHGALRALGITPQFVSAQETMDDLCSWLDDHMKAGYRRGGVSLGAQVHGGETIGTLDTLRPKVTDLRTVAPYRWVLPDDLSGARAVVRMIAAGEVDVLMQTSAPSARNMFAVAAELGLENEVITRLRGEVCVAVVGPVTARAFEDLGIAIDVMPQRPRTADLLRMTCYWALTHESTPRPEPDVSKIELVPGATVVRIGPEVIRLGRQEFAVLAALVRRPGVVLRADELALQAWGHRTPDDATQVRHYVSRLRRKLGEHGTSVQTVRNVGYRYRASNE